MLFRWFQRVYRINAAATRWFRRRLTPAGYFALAGLLLTSAAANSEQTLALQAFFLIVAMLGLGMLTAPFFRFSGRIHRTPPRFATAGEPFPVRVRLTNLTTKTQSGLEYLEHLEESPIPAPELQAQRSRPRSVRRFHSIPRPSIQSARSRMVPVPTLPPKGHAEFQIEVVAYRRGPLVLAGGYIARPDPIGLFRALVHIPEPRTTLILPKRYPLPPLDLPGKNQYQRGGVALASGVGEAEEFVALRDYRRGDSMRRIHWRSTARLGKLVVKECQDEFLVRHALVLDTYCPPERDGLFEEAIAVAASFACTVPDQDSLLDLLFVGASAVCVTTGRGVGQPEQLLEALATAKPRRDADFEELQSLVLRHLPSLGGAILVFLIWNDARRALVRKLRALGLPTLVLLVVPPFSTDPIAASSSEDRPNQWALLEAGRIAEGLQELAASP